MNYKEFFTNANITNINELFNYANNNITFGWMDQKGNIKKDRNDGQTYCLQTPQELLNSHVGNCWDLTELYRCFFENMTNLKYETYYLLYDDNQGCPSHTILVYYQNNKVYWFEPLFYSLSFKYCGIHEYNNIFELLKDLKKQFIKSAIEYKSIPKKYNEKNILLYKYDKPPYHINGFEMRNHINKSELIHI